MAEIIDDHRRQTVELRKKVVTWRLTEMRNQHGLYDWPRWVQVLICLRCGIPLKAVGKYPSQQVFADHCWANANPWELNEIGLKHREEARLRLGLTL